MLGKVSETCSNGNNILMTTGRKYDLDMVVDKIICGTLQLVYTVICCITTTMNRYHCVISLYVGSYMIIHLCDEFVY